MKEIIVRHYAKARHSSRALKFVFDTLPRPSITISKAKLKSKITENKIMTLQSKLGNSETSP